MMKDMLAPDNQRVDSVEGIQHLNLNAQRGGAGDQEPARRAGETVLPPLRQRGKLHSVEVSQLGRNVERPSSRNSGTWHAEQDRDERTLPLNSPSPVLSSPHARTRNGSLVASPSRRSQAQALGSVNVLGPSSFSSSEWSSNVSSTGYGSPVGMSFGGNTPTRGRRLTHVMGQSPVNHNRPSLSSDFVKKTSDEESFNLDLYEPTLITKGGQGSVYGGKDPISKEPIAVKVTDMGEGHNTANSTREFEVYTALAQDERINGRLPYLCYGDELVSTPSRNIVVMKKYPLDLFTALKNDKEGFTCWNAARIGLRVLEAANALHRINFVHRDIKAENILLSSHDILEAEVILCDYGLCGVIDKGSQLRSSCGSRRYSAPEVWNKKPEESYDGVQVDKFSVGVVYFGLLTGFFPWDQASNDNKIYKLWSRDPIMFFKWAKKYSRNPISSHSKRIMLGLMAPVPSERVTTADAIKLFEAELAHTKANAV